MGLPPNLNPLIYPPRQVFITMAHNCTLSISVVTDEKAIALDQKYLGKYDNPAMGVQLLINLLAKIGSGAVPGKIFVFADKGDGTAATGTVACTQASAVTGDTFVICGVTFTVAATPSTRPDLGQFAAGASDTDMGDNLAAAINAHPALKGMLTAVAVTGTVTWTLADKGIQGNLARATETGSSMAVTNPTNGATGTVQRAFTIFRRGK